MITPEGLKEAAKELRHAAELMPDAELVHFAESTLQVATFAQKLLRERSPALWTELNRKVESGELVSME